MGDLLKTKMMNKEEFVISDSTAGIMTVAGGFIPRLQGRSVTYVTKTGAAPPDMATFIIVEVGLPVAGGEMTPVDYCNVVKENIS